MGRALDITVPGSLTGQAPQKHSFTFDKVFAATADQAAVFEEISELIQSALDGHKVRKHVCHAMLTKENNLGSSCTGKQLPAPVCMLMQSR